MNTFVCNINRWILLFLTASLATACNGEITGGPVKGKVVIAGTDKPVAGAWVGVRWIGKSSNLAHNARYNCYHAAVTQTRNDGSFEIPRWRFTPGEQGYPAGLANIERVLDQPLEVIAYAKGYTNEKTRWATGRSLTIELTPSSVTPQERLRYLYGGGVVFGCSVSGFENQRPVAGAYRAKAAEVAALAMNNPEDIKEKSMVLENFSTLIACYESHFGGQADTPSKDSCAPMSVILRPLSAN
jgi:hypothetical protein